MVDNLLRRLAEDAGQYEFDEVGLEILQEQWCYEKLSVIAEGGMATILLGTHEGHRTVIKVLNAILARSEAAVAAFRQEAEILQQLGGVFSPKLEQGYSLCGKSGYHVFGMQEITGHSLEDLMLQDGAYSPKKASKICVKASRGLEFLESKNIVHRDIKPGNIVLDDIEHQGRIVLVDFGLACGIQQACACREFVGTRIYASPEQLYGRSADCRSDIFSLGVTLWQLCTAKLPFGIGATDCSGDGTERIMQCRAKNSLEQRDIPDGLFAVIQKAAASRPEDRYQHAADMTAALRSLNF